MDLQVSAGYDVFSGSLDCGEFDPVLCQDIVINNERQLVVAKIDFSGRSVAVLLSSYVEDGRLPPVNGLNGANLRFVPSVDVGFDHLWGRLSLKKLKKNRGITLVESKPRVIKTLGEIRYSQRLNSFYRGTGAREVVHPLFDDTDRFDPEVLAEFGWEYAPQKYETEDQAKASWRYYIDTRYAPKTVNKYLLEATAKDTIKSCVLPQHCKLFNLVGDQKFPNRLHTEDGTADSLLEKIIEDIRKIQQANLLSVGDQPHNAVVVKLAGWQDYLFTTEENRDKLDFATFSDSELCTIFQESWQEFIVQADFVDFERCALPVLNEILPGIDAGVKKVVDLANVINGNFNSEIACAISFDGERIGRKMIEFRSLWQRMAVTQKKIDFYQCVKKYAPLKRDSVSRDTCSDYFLNSNIMDLDFRGVYEGLISQKEYLESFRQWFVEFSVREEQLAGAALKTSSRELAIIKVKIGGQAELVRMLVNMSGKLIGAKYSFANSKPQLSDECYHLSCLINDVLALIEQNKLVVDSDYGSDFDALDLATNLPSLGKSLYRQSPRL